MFIFSDPHPGGIMGCLKPLPDGVKLMVDDMDGKRMSLAAALIRIARALDAAGITGMQLKSHSNEDKTEGWIGLTQGSVKNPPCHSWRLIKYSEEKP